MKNDGIARRGWRIGMALAVFGLMTKVGPIAAALIGLKIDLILAVVHFSWLPIWQIGLLVAGAASVFEAVSEYRNYRKTKMRQEAPQPKFGHSSSRIIRVGLAAFLCGAWSFLAAHITLRSFPDLWHLPVSIGAYEIYECWIQNFTDLEIVSAFILSILSSSIMYILSFCWSAMGYHAIVRKVRRAAVAIFIASFPFVICGLLPALSRAREKPVIYLYPTHETTVNVKLDYDGLLIKTWPEYSADGWNVVAKPSGELTDVKTGVEYEYLFWEGIDLHRYSTDQGFVVAGTETQTFLESALYGMGLSEEETGDFIEYWLPRMEKNPFNIIHFATDEFDRTVPIEVTPVPDTVIRVFMLFRASNERIEISPQQFNHIDRHGFTIVEWGGTELH